MMNRRVIPIAMDTIFTKGWKNSGTVSCFSCMMKRCHQTIHWPSGKLANTKETRNRPLSFAAMRLWRTFVKPWGSFSPCVFRESIFTHSFLKYLTDQSRNEVLSNRKIGQKSSFDVLDRFFIPIGYSLNCNKIHLYLRISAI